MHATYMHWNELVKQSAYDERWEIEHETFSPLVFSLTGGMGTPVQCSLQETIIACDNENNIIYILSQLAINIINTINKYKRKLSHSLQRSMTKLYSKTLYILY